MNTPLQRLVDRARGGQQGPAMRIEPLLGAPFAMPADAVHDLPEVEIETEADPPASVSAASPPSTPRHVQPSRASVNHRAAPLRSALSSPDMPQPAAKPATAGHDGQATKPPARSQPAAAAEAVRGQETRHTADAAHMPAPALPRHAPSGSGMPRAPVPAAQPQQVRLAPIEVAPSITIAIGRIEVRNAPAPTSAGSPHRPFKPGLSLDAFLRRGKGDG